MLRVVVKHNVLKITPKRSCEAAPEAEQSNLNVNSNIALCPIYKCAVKKESKNLPSERNQDNLPSTYASLVTQS